MAGELMRPLARALHRENTPRRRSARGAIVLALAIGLALGVPVSCTPDVAPTPAASPTPTTPAPPQGSAPTVTPDDVPRPVPPLVDAPRQDRLSLVRLYTGVDAQPLPLETLYPDEPVGTTRRFWTIDAAGPSMFTIEAELRHVGEHALWYVSVGASVSDTRLATAARAFDEEIYPEVIRLFAREAAPHGKLTIVNARLGPGLAGYFAGADALPAEAWRFSNERAAIFMASANFGSDRYLGTLAHELQHWAHWLVDRDEVTWVHEGLSELAATSLGLPALPPSAYLLNPGVSITLWPEIGQSITNYAGASLFFSYLSGRTGLDNIHRLVAQSADGGEGIQAYLDEVAPGEQFDDLFTDWVAANVAGATEGRFAYPPPMRAVNIAGGVSRAIEGEGAVAGEAPQFGAWYLRIVPGDAPLTVTISGAERTAVLPVDPPGGDSCWWGNRGDNIDATLTRPVDLTGLDQATLRFWTWYDIEEAWDRAYVAASADAGASWTALAGGHTTASDPIGSSLGHSYTGRSDGWVRETIDLSPFAGAPMLLRFEYVTDDAISNTGWCVADISIERQDLSDGEWTANGFIDLSAEGVSQRFMARLVTGAGAEAQVTNVPFDSSNRAEFTVDAPSVLAVTGLSTKTSQPGRVQVVSSRRTTN